MKIHLMIEFEIFKFNSKFKVHFKVQFKHTNPNMTFNVF